MGAALRAAGGAMAPLAATEGPVELAAYGPTTVAPAPAAAATALLSTRTTRIMALRSGSI